MKRTAEERHCQGLPYTLYRSDRKTTALKIDHEARVVVLAPRNAPLSLIEGFVEKNLAWIKVHQSRRLSVKKRTESLSPERMEALKRQARDILGERTAVYAEKMGLSYRRITISSAKTRFGSCNEKGDIMYSWRLLLYPEPAWDYVVVHELAHLKHMNHSPAFYQVVAAYLPDYKERKKLLKA